MLFATFLPSVRLSAGGWARDRRERALAGSGSALQDLIVVVRAGGKGTLGGNVVRSAFGRDMLDSGEGTSPRFNASIVTGCDVAIAVTDHEGGVFESNGLRANRLGTEDAPSAVVPITVDGDAAPSPLPVVRAGRRNRLD